MNLNQLFESLSADQRKAKQLPADFRAPNTSPQLAGPYPGRNATRGYLVGEADESDLEAKERERLLTAFKKKQLPQQNFNLVQRVTYDQLKSNPMAQAVIRRITNAHPEWLMQYGPDAVMQAVADVTGGEDDWEEIGSSDVSAYVGYVSDYLRDHMGSREEMADRKPFAEETDTGEYDARKTAPSSDEDKEAVFARHRERVKNIDQDREQDVAEAMKPSDIPPSMRQRLTMRDIEAERPRGAFRFRVVTPQGDRIDFMDQGAAEQRARAIGGRVELIDPQPRGNTRRGMDSVTEYKIKKKSDQDQDNFTADDIKRLEAITDLETLKAQAKQLIKGKPARRMKPEKIAYFYDKIDDMPSRLQIIKLMYDLLLSGEGHQVIGTKWSTDPNTYRRRFGESLRPGEYHIATVTLDDGTKKKVQITSDEGFRDQIEQHFRKQGRQVRNIEVDYGIRSDLDERTQTTIEQDLARRMAAEDVLGDVSRRLGDVLKQRRQRRAERMPVKQAPQDVLGDPVKRVNLGNSNVLMIHGNEDDGFRIHLGQRVMPARFATVEQAEMATRIYEARLAERKEPKLRKTARSTRIMQQLRAQYPEAQTDLEALLYDFRRGQTQDRRDITRLDTELDYDEAEIDQIQDQLDRLKKQRNVGSDLDEAKKDACYHKVKSRYKVWPSAYASGALVQCRKQGAANWGTKKQEK